MKKRLAVRVEEYEKDGQTKGKYLDVGVILENDNGEFALLNPCVDLSGVLMKQRLLAAANGKKAGDMVMCSIFTDEPNPQAQTQAPPADGFPNETGPWI